ncbi:hypothetical protein LPJ59_002697 [Coemansia sp. RSA 2399]|nr:hypothetical protein LPJ59_002697 [Coemansia sp. RSA 2399]KAJ1905158.1 hypothetical protein LPJ81_002078 [Coemansia sp. IMI 209127]
MGSADDPPPDSAPFFTFMEAGGGGGGDNGTNMTAPQSLAVDDYIAAHIVTDPPEPTKPTEPAPAPLPQLAAHKKGTTPTAAAAAALFDQVHPMIRSRRLNTPEEIAAWIAERRAKYPTDANMRRKAAEQASGDSDGTHVSNKRKRTEGEGNDGSKAAPKNALAAAMALYGTAGSDDNDDGSDVHSSDESAEMPESAPAKSLLPNVPFRASGIAPGEDRRKLRVCKYFSRGACVRGMACPFAHPESLQKTHGEHPGAASSAASTNRSQEGLLHRLLAKDIERENHRVFQCIQYICDNDFLGVPARYDLLYQS